jgi:hypothetical protein
VGVQVSQQLTDGGVTVGLVNALHQRIQDRPPLVDVLGQGRQHMSDEYRVWG